jgi:hypothetical protein
MIELTNKLINRLNSLYINNVDGRVYYKETKSKCGSRRCWTCPIFNVNVNTFDKSIPFYFTNCAKRIYVLNKMLKMKIWRNMKNE